MLYPTHKKFGIYWGLLMIPVSVMIGLIPSVSSSMRMSDLVLIIVSVYMGMRGALFGSRFPDIDSPTSIPAKKHPYIQKIFHKFGVKHRGKYSHDYASIGLTFLILYILVAFGGEKLLLLIYDDHKFLNVLVYAVCLFFIHMISNDIIDIFQAVANIQKNKKMFAILESNKTKISILISIIMLITLAISGTVELLGIITFSISTVSAIKIATLVIVSLKVYVVFALVGAYSHLYADMTTKQGVYIFGKQLAPMRTILLIKKIPIFGKLLIPSEFKTNSEWENMNNLIVTLLCFPASILAFLFLIGFSFEDILKVLGYK